MDTFNKEALVGFSPNIVKTSAKFRCQWFSGPWSPDDVTMFCSSSGQCSVFTLALQTSDEVTRWVVVTIL